MTTETNPKNVPGTPLSGQQFESEVLKEHWVPDARYTWDAGVAIGRYLGGLKEGMILGGHCRKCDRTVVPPRMFCEECFQPMDEYVRLQETGTVNTFSLSHVTWDVTLLEEPDIPAVIEIDGADPGMGILHLLDEVDPQEVKIGLRVRAVWKPPEERTGAITDIKYFKPISE